MVNDQREHRERGTGPADPKESLRIRAAAGAEGLQDLGVRTGVGHRQEIRVLLGHEAERERDQARHGQRLIDQRLDREPITRGAQGHLRDLVDDLLLQARSPGLDGFPQRLLGREIVQQAGLGHADRIGFGAAGYSYSKRAVARLVHDLALQLAPLSIRVNAVHPGNINTDMLQNDAMYQLFRPDLEHPTHDDAQAAFGSMHKMPVNTLDPVDISEAVLYLASDAARYVTGQQLKVEAGALLAMTTSGAPA